MNRRVRVVMWLWFAWVIAIFLIAAALVSHSAHARDLGQWEQTDAVTSAWFQALRQPDNPAISCCGESDAYWADTVIVEGDKVFAIVTDDRSDEPLKRPHIAVGTRFEIPPRKMMDSGGNPTGHNVLFVGTGGVYCFVTGTLG